MTQEEKELLLKDLCARLPYGIKCYEADVEYTFDIIGTTANNKEFVFSDGYERNLEQIKPYLRPLSNMTEEERAEMYHDCYVLSITTEYRTTDMVAVPNAIRIVNYLLQHHFDIYGLIDKGLALEAPEGMYN